MPATETRFMLDMRGVAKRFGANEGPWGVSLPVPRGQTVVAIGPGGSEKTTLLRCVKMLEDHEAGNVAVDGTPVGYTIGSKPGYRQRMVARDNAAARVTIGIVFMDGGFIVEDVPPESLVVAPKTERVRQFLKRHNDRYRI